MASTSVILDCARPRPPLDMNDGLTVSSVILDKVTLDLRAYSAYANMQGEAPFACSSAFHGYCAE